MRYTVRYATNRPDLTGEWHEEAWVQADTLEIAHFRPEGSDHQPRTLARLLWDERGLYGIFQVQDRYVRCVHTGYMVPVYLDSCVEIFLQPKVSKGYLNFEFNCGGSMLCFYIVDATRVPGGFRDFTRLPEVDGKQVSVCHSMPMRVEPEIVDPTRWYLEFCIPFSVLEKWVGSLGPAGGQEWRANLYKCGDETSHPHWASWAPLDESNFHLPRCFGTIHFEKVP
ncbi:MAG TPA: carbohydrate-binding family 9-like protein [Candidatus Tectomicrobia bacterium]